MMLPQRIRQPLPLVDPGAGLPGNDHPDTWLRLAFHTAAGTLAVSPASLVACWHRCGRYCSAGGPYTDDCLLVGRLFSG